jgi:hypothetical protein
MDADDPMRRLSKSLGFDYYEHEQDWGIVNANAARLDEFIGFALTRPFDVVEGHYLVDLVLASANERLLVEPHADIDAIETILDLFPDAAALFQPYWASLVDAEQFPLGAWLRARRTDSRRF